MKADLFSDRWSQPKKHIKTSLVLYIRSMQKQLAPMGYHYRAQDMEGKQHLEHPIPQNKIITAYLHDRISAEQVLQMPLCLIDDADKHILENDWQQLRQLGVPIQEIPVGGLHQRRSRMCVAMPMDFWTHTPYRITSVCWAWLTLFKISI
jgi:hypothetical protein